MRVLSIQSHVVYGMVGNNVAVPTLERFKIEVDALNVVQFSNHTGYKVFRGTRLKPQEFADILEGLQTNGILDLYNVVLSGYIGNVGVLQELAKFIRSMRQRKTLALYLCDPVCGDAGKLYVPLALCEVYAKEVLPLCDIATPNGFEASVISGIEVNSIDSAKRAANWFHDCGVGRVVITSFFDEQCGNDVILLFGSEQVGTVRDQWVMRIPMVNGGFSGSGDLFSSLLLAHVLQQETWKRSVELTVAAIQGVLRCTMAHASDSGEWKELSLVPCLGKMVSPEINILAETIGSLQPQ